MPQIHFPRLGDRILLDHDWTFPLHLENRNLSLFKAVGLLWNVRPGLPKYSREYIYVSPELPAVHRYSFGGGISVPVTLPAGTLLRIDRLYFRQGVRAYDSITFRIHGSPERRLLNDIRFWAKADDANMSGDWHEGAPHAPVRDKSAKRLVETPIEQREDSPAFGLPVPKEVQEMIARRRG